jgi:hypothetical protein
LTIIPTSLDSSDKRDRTLIPMAGTIVLIGRLRRANIDSASDQLMSA